MDNKISAYDAKYKKQFASRCFEDVTAVAKLGYLIDDSWHYSWHWPDEIDIHWFNCVQDDLNKRISQVKDELRDLKLAQSILDRIEVKL